MIELLHENFRMTDVATDMCCDALFAAMRSKHTATVRLLLGYRVHPSLEILCQACATGCLEVVVSFVGAGVSVDAKDGADEPPLHIAACHLQSNIVRLLVEKGADVQ